METAAWGPGVQENRWIPSPQTVTSSWHMVTGSVLTGKDYSWKPLGLVA
jgi:hypothetical protein